MLTFFGIFLSRFVSEASLSIRDPKSAGGDLDFFPRGMMVQEFEEAAFGAQVGEIVGVVETVHGYHIIKVEEKRIARYFPGGDGGKYQELPFGE